MSKVFLVITLIGLVGISATQGIQGDVRVSIASLLLAIANGLLLA
jgi:hypothetical protein